MKATFDRAVKAIKQENIKNGCRLCFETVTPKNGIVCQGDCESWVHYRCLEFTPGQILDLKAGTLKVKCPCPNCGPNCRTALDEVLIKPNTNCNRRNCPSNQKLICESEECPQAHIVPSSNPKVKNKRCPDDCPDSEEPCVNVYKKMDPRDCSATHTCCVCGPNDNDASDDSPCCVCDSDKPEEDSSKCSNDNLTCLHTDRSCCRGNRSSDSQIFLANNRTCHPRRPEESHKQEKDNSKRLNDNQVSQANKKPSRSKESSKQEKYNSRHSNEKQVPQANKMYIHNSRPKELSIQEKDSSKRSCGKHANKKPCHASRSEEFPKQEKDHPNHSNGMQGMQVSDVNNNRDSIHYITYSNKKTSCHDNVNKSFEVKNSDGPQKCRKNKIQTKNKSDLHDKNSVRGMLSPFSQQACLDNSDVREMYIPRSKKAYEKTDFEAWYNTDSILRVSRSDVINVASVPVSAGEPVRRRSDLKLNSDSLSEDKARILLAMDEMYQTVGLFQNQIKNLINTVKETLGKKLK